MTPEQFINAYTLFLVFAGIIFLLLLAVYAVAVAGIIINTKRKEDD